MRSRPGARGPAGSLRLLAYGCAVVAVMVGALTGWGDLAFWAVPVLAVAVAVAEVGVVRLSLGRRRWDFSLTEAALGAALVASTGAWTVVAVVAGVALAQRGRHQSRRKREFLLARHALACSLAQAMAGLTGGGTAGACAGVAAFWAVNYVLTALAVSLSSQRPLRSLLTSAAPQSALQCAGNSSVGLLAAALAVQAPLGLVGLAVPLALLWSSQDQQQSRGAEARLFAELARGREQPARRSQDGSAQGVMTAAARLLGGADVELLLLAPDGPVRLVGDETGVTARRRVTSDVFDEQWVLRALGERDAHLGRDDGRPFVCAVLGDPDAPLAVLRARRGVDAAAFDRADLRLIRVLVRQAGAWLHVGELGQAADDHPARTATTPALMALRESADRLARLADSGEVDDVVEELHLVEQAVLSLLGARALGVDPGEPVRSAEPAPTTTRATPDWTTTGVLA